MVVISVTGKGSIEKDEFFRLILDSVPFDTKWRTFKMLISRDVTGEVIIDDVRIEEGE